MNDWRTREEAAIKIACIQMEPVIGEKERNVRRSLELIEDAAANGAHLLVLPELCNLGYVFDSREEAFALAEEIPNGPTCRGWQEAARQARPCTWLAIATGVQMRESDPSDTHPIGVCPRPSPG
jgi:predicted amidohydrolase